ncbi:1-deoxy-D-xylulose-5-phosphate reductoisomerase [Mumia sp. ZJ430]|uniref:1-deoxy-D-xylulose-5-phosphate reductoisomerase n=1 Tax=Mumia sp. ZJ430 TaxID=2708083 RepID=UPI001FB98BF3|nr:1-deoxy-D-xylulose-5-phosphate reductoisomerase [Mumia sp. ZJ430]
MPTARRRDVVVLGSTGSIGTQALELVTANPDRFRVTGIAAGGSDPVLLAQQAIAHEVEIVAVAQATAAQDVQLALYAEAQRRGYAEGQYRLPRILAGPRAATELAATPCDVVLNGITGAVGLGPTIAALEAGTTLALANKESLIIGGPVVTALARPGQIVPVDSEHSAIAQALRSGTADEVRRLVLTASGGPFRGRTRDELTDVTPEQALAHPNFAMGPVITINSATLVNKGLEVIEAHLLFDVPMERVDVVVHPQQMIHSMVEFVDGSTIAQASPPSMLIPIALGMGWPDRVPDAGPGCDWTKASQWDFAALDDDAFPAVRLARRAGTAGGTAPAVYNAANEACVASFLAGELPFLGIVDTVGAVLDEHLTAARVLSEEEPLTVDDVLAADTTARTRTHELIAGHQSAAKERR